MNNDMSVGQILFASKSYTDKALKGMGALKGAPCTIKSIIPTSNGNEIIFEWVGTDGQTCEDSMVVKNGESISGDDYVEKSPFEELKNKDIEVYDGNYNSSGAFRYVDNSMLYIVQVDENDLIEFAFDADTRVAYVSDWHGYYTLKVDSIIPNLVSVKTHGAKQRVPSGAKYALLSGVGKLSKLLINNANLLDIKYNRLLDSKFKYNTTDILALNDLTETEDLLQQAKCDVGYNGGKKTEQNPKLCLMQISDIHNSEEQFIRALRVANYFKKYIDDVINTGDTCRNLYGQISETMFTNPGAEKVMNVVGNHDAGINASTTATEEQLFDMLMKSFIGSSGAVYSENHCYYYKDYAQSKIRMVVLDLFHWNDEQSAWFENALSGAKDNDYHVIGVAHSTPYEVDRITNTPFSNILKKSSTSVPNEGICDIVDSFIDDGGIFIVWLVGHLHSHDFSKIKKHERQKVFSCPTVNWQEMLRGLDTRRTYGHKSQDSMQFVIFDTFLKLFKVVTFGNDKDIFMRERKTFCYDYGKDTILT